MPAPLLLLLGLFILGMAGLGLLQGKVVAGARGLHTHYCHRSDQPLQYGAFVLFYLLGGAFAVFQALQGGW